MSRKKAGLAPGSVIYTGEKRNNNVNVHICNFNTDTLIAKTYDGKKQDKSLSKQDDKLIWYDIRGIHDTDLIQHFGNKLNMHPLVLEDVVNVHQRAKYEEFEDGIFITLKALSFDRETLSVKKEHLSIYFRDGELISFQEDETDLFGTIRQRLENKNSKLRSKNSDYLAYALIDCIVDNYFEVLDALEDVIDEVETDLINKEDTEQKYTIHHLKKEFLLVRKSINPLRELISRFAKSDSELINQSTEIYLRDLQDHTIQLIDITETYRDILNGLYDLLMTNVSFKMNQIMQVLTIISTIFIPLTFLAGIYGMNFDNIPELHNKHGYYYFWGVIIIISAGLVTFFKRKNWF